MRGTDGSAITRSAGKAGFDPPEKKKALSELVNPIVAGFGIVALKNISVSKHAAIQWMRGQGIMIDPQSVKKPFCIVRLLCSHESAVRAANEKIQNTQVTRRAPPA